MKGGDIGDEGGVHVIRVALVWEGVCAEPPRENPGLRERVARIRGREEDWEKVVRSWTVHEKPLGRIYAMHMRGIPVDIVTYLGYEYCEALRDYLEHLLVDVSRVEYFEDAEHFARALRISPDIQYVVDSDSARLKVYGHRAMAVRMGDDWGQFI